MPPPQDKAVPCKLLAVYGTKEAVPALAPLLLDKDLSSWARIALEAISDPPRMRLCGGALTKAQGRLLVGVINSIGVRRDGGRRPRPHQQAEGRMSIFSTSCVSLISNNRFQPTFAVSVHSVSFLKVMQGILSIYASF